MSDPIDTPITRDYTLGVARGHLKTHLATEMFIQAMRRQYRWHQRARLAIAMRLHRIADMIW